ncbi:MAG: plasmid stabilization system protein ParE, partial [Halieaceae bacterium]
AYTSSILACMNWLSDNRGTDKPRKDVKPGYFYFPEKRHFIFYIMTDGTGDVTGMPHQSMDVMHHLVE